MIEAECPDLVHADFGTPELVKEACYKLFQERHPGAVSVATQAELDKQVANGMIDVIITSRTTNSILKSTPAYQRTEKVLTIVTPSEVVESWLRENRKYMRKEAIVNFKELSRKATGWKPK